MALKVILAGYNVDCDVIDELKKSAPSRNDITPETFSASYARISRDPRPVNELRSVARKEVEKARHSNQNIIFKMGHHSVAEHAVFNFDVMGVSRLAIEEIEKFRLCSFTEKSQRYITLGDDYIIPDEIKRAGKQKVFIDTINAQNALYHELYRKLRPYVFETHRDLAKNPKKHRVLEGWAKEDARYVVSLAVLGQLGLTINARNLEFLIRRFASKELEELREFNRHIYALAKKVAPSIILFTEPNDFDARTYGKLKEEAQSIEAQSKGKKSQRISLVDFTPDADTKLIASLLHTVTSLSYKECLKRAKSLSDERKREYIKTAFKYMEFHDGALREFEFVDLTYDLVISATCFAQLKRHRMATLTTQKYNPELGVAVPPSIIEIGAKKKFIETIEKTNETYRQLKNNIDNGVDYILTNAHQRRVLLKVNARELYHISRLREDTSAQWDIQDVVKEMRKLAEKVMPLSCILIGGKNVFPDIYKKIYNQVPKLMPPEY